MLSIQETRIPSPLRTAGAPNHWTSPFGAPAQADAYGMGFDGTGLSVVTQSRGRTSAAGRIALPKTGVVTVPGSHPRGRPV